MNKNIYRVIPFLYKYKLKLVFIIFSILLFATSNVFFIPLVRDLSKEISNQRVVHFSYQILNAFILWSIRTLTLYYKNTLMEWVSAKIAVDIKQIIYKKYCHFSQNFYSKRKVGDLMTRLFNDAQQVRDSLLYLFADLVPQTITLIGVIVYLFTLNYKLTLFTLISVPCFVLSISYFSNIAKRISAQVQKKIANITHVAQEIIQNIKLTQAYTMESHEINKFQGLNINNMKHQYKAVKYNEIKKMIELLLQGIVFILILFVGGQLVTNNQLKSHELISFFTGIALLIDPVIAISQSFLKLSQAAPSIDRIFEILDEPIIIKSPPNGIKQKISGQIRFENVSFSYDKSNTEYALENVSLDIQAGTTIALVGLSGAGKSTLVDLIPRFNDPTNGEIHIDGIGLKQFDLFSLRSQIGIVLQDQLLFNGSILENIKYGSPDAKEKDVITAAKLANAWEFIDKLPNKLFTNIGNHGNRLSGGQKQRLSIARSFLKNPKILILDEPTSALDAQSEKMIQDALKKLVINRTTFIIAHRFSTITSADTICVLDNGKVTQMGPHKELIKKEGKYQDLYNLQSK